MVHGKPVTDDPARLAVVEAAETAARDAYGRLVATLCRSTRDLAAAEDALGDAFARALETWPRDGVPDVPAAWLLTTARRRLTDAARHSEVAQRHAQTTLPLLDEMARTPRASDRRVDLMLICAHPSIDARVRAPLMLQTVFGLTAQQIASAFALSPASLGQRLARAKRAIKANNLSFDAALDDDTDVTSERLAAVLDAIYAAFGTGWADVAGAEDLRHGLANEALWLGRLVAARCPDHPEAHGLLALMLFAQSRRAARRSASDRFVPLSEQDTSRWDQEMIALADVHLARAAALSHMGRYQLEAAIQAHHAHPPVNAEAVAVLYEGLVRLAPSRASWVGRAAALGEARGAAAGLGALAHLSPDDVRDDASYWAVKAHLHRKADQPDQASEAWRRAIGLTEDPAVRDYLMARLASLGGG